MKRLNILTTAALINPLELCRHVTEKGLRSIPISHSWPVNVITWEVIVHAETAAISRRVSS